MSIITLSTPREIHDDRSVARRRPLDDRRRLAPRRARSAGWPGSPSATAAAPSSPGSLALVLAIGLASAFGGEFKADYSAPGSDSQQAQNLLEDQFPAQSGDTVDVVVHADGGVAGRGQQDVAALLAELADVPHVAAVADPYADPGGICRTATRSSPTCASTW